MAVMNNMKEVLVESAAHILANRYGPLTNDVCQKLLGSFEALDFVKRGDARDLLKKQDDLAADSVYLRMFWFLQYVCRQFFEEKRSKLLATARIRTALLTRDMTKEFKEKILEINKMAAMVKPWKREGPTLRA
jgi:hypothetical protein